MQPINKSKMVDDKESYGLSVGAAADDSLTVNTDVDST